MTIWRQGMSAEQRARAAHALIERTTASCGMPFYVEDDAVIESEHNVAEFDRGYSAVAVVYFMEGRLRCLFADCGRSSVYIG